ncbi:hypothetical protein EC968_001250 [Mortierella alpina]|nr:hypothetical protein EC968_001250 [Mortierella alpina]
MSRPEQGGHVQETIATFSRLMTDNNANNKSMAVLPLLTINNSAPVSSSDSASESESSPPSLSSPSSGASSLPSPASLKCSSSPATTACGALAATVATAETTVAASKKGTSSDSSDLPTTFLFSHPTFLLPMPTIPAAAFGSHPTPSCTSVHSNSRNSSITGAGVVGSLTPLVGRDYLGYSSLNAALATGKLDAGVTSRPLSSMEHAESWLPAPASPTSTAVALNAVSNPGYEVRDNSTNSIPIVSNSGISIEIKSPFLPERDQAGGMRVSMDQQSIHPFQMDPDQATSCAEPDLSAPQPQQQAQQMLRKKTSFAEKLRKVFVSKQGPSAGLQSRTQHSQEDIISLSSGDGYTSALASTSFADQHRGSVSSSSSADTGLGQSSGLRRGSNQTITPLTSPEASPPNSPKLNVLTVLPASVPSAVPYQRLELPMIAGELPSSDSERGVEANEKGPEPGLPRDQTTVESGDGTPRTVTRTVKKRLSFASISSFFSTRSIEDGRSKQQRASSLPHVENPLVVVGRQIAGFQRRHSLNDLDDNGKASKATASSEPLTGHVVPRAVPTKKLSLNNVFGKKLKKKKSTSAPKPELSVPPKPLRSALVQRQMGPGSPKMHHVHKSSRRRSTSIRSHNSAHRHRRHHHHHHHHHNYQQQQHSQAQADPFARLAEANQALANLSRRGSEDHHAIRQQLRRASQQQHPRRFSTSDDPLFCASPSSYGPAGGSPLSEQDEDAASGPNAFLTPSTPKVLPVITKTFSDIPTRSEQGLFTPPHNPLCTLSPSSSCCSYSSSSDGTQASLRSTSSISDCRSCNSSCSEGHEMAVTAVQSGSRRSSKDQDYNPLLPASAARVSVERISMKNQLNASKGHLFSNDQPVPSSLKAATSSSMSVSSTETCSSYSPSVQDCSIFANATHIANMNKVGGNVFGSQQAYALQKQNASRQPYQHHYLPEHQHQIQQIQQQLAAPRFLPEYHSQNPHHHHQEYPSQPQHHQKYYYPHPSIYPPRPPRQLQFSMEEPIVHPTWPPEQYDRTSDPNITASRLTPAIAQKIKLELNEFKSEEMEVHQDSRGYTHFFV